MISVKELKLNFSDFISEIEGSDETTFSQVSSLSNSKEDSLIFFNNVKALRQASSILASVVVVQDKLKTKIKPQAKTTYIFSAKPDVLVARILEKYFAFTVNKNVELGIAPSVIHGENCKFADSVRIGANCVIGNNVTIEENVSIGPNTFIGDNVFIDKDSHIDAMNYIGDNCKIGKFVRVQSQNALSVLPFSTSGALQSKSQGLVLEDRVELGAGNVIESGLSKATRIGTGAKFDNRVFIGSEAHIGPHSFLTAGVRVGHGVSTGHHFVVGGNTVIEPQVQICDMVQVAGISCVNKDIQSPGAYGGFPIQPMKDYLKTTMTLTKIPEIRKELNQLVSKYETKD